MLFDKAGGRFHDPGKVHFLDHKGEFFSVRGPLNIARSPQNTPVLVMSGLLETELDFAARVADIVLLDGLSPADAKSACDGLKNRVVAAGRRPDALKILATLPVGPEFTADKLHRWLDKKNCDGLNFALPGDLSVLDRFTGRVLPELRGLTPPIHAGTMLRDHLGLDAGGQ